MMMEQQRKPVVQWFLKHKASRTFIFEFFTCVFLTFMCLSTVYLPPFEGHPHDPNIFHMIIVALVVYSIICFSGPITGAHINPAVTLALFSSKKWQKGDLRVVCAYVVAQMGGCTLGCIFSKMFFDQGGPVYLVFPDALELMKDCAEEFAGTFLLIMFIFILSNEETTFVHSEAWGHLLIGVVYYFCLTYCCLTQLRHALPLHQPRYPILLPAAGHDVHRGCACRHTPRLPPARPSSAFRGLAQPVCLHQALPQAGQVLEGPVQVIVYLLGSSRSGRWGG